MPKTAVSKTKSERKDYIHAFADAVAQFASRAHEEVLPHVPGLAVSGLDAARSELWLWDESSGTGYLTHAAGLEASHRRDYAELGSGVVGQAAQARMACENLSLTTTTEEGADFVARTHLTHISAYPLKVKGRLLGVLANYSSGEVDIDLLRFWEMYAEISGLAVQESLAAKDSQRRITQLSLLFEATRLLNSTLDVAELLELILKIARTEARADRGTVFLVDRAHQQIWSIVASGLEQQEIRLPIGSGVAGRVGQTGEIVNVEDAYTLPFFEQSFDKKFGYRTRSLMCLPIRHHNGEIVGVIQLLNKTTGPRFTLDDEDFLIKLSGHMAMALENARLHREVVEKQRLEKELALARAIQRSLLPEAPPIVPGYEIAVLNKPCYEVGGDYYDFLNLGPQTLLLVIADVEGKGVSSAMIMSNLQATLRALIMHLHSLEVLTLSLNEMICNDTKSQKFLSIFLGLVDTRRNGLHYINAGHVPPILVSGATGEVKLLQEGGMVVGLFQTAEYQRGSVRLQPGDVLVCCTDGILEACNIDEEEYGTERMGDCVARNRTKTAQEIVDIVLSEAETFSAGGVHVDDKVLMVVKVTGDGKMTQAAGSKKLKQ